MTLVLRLVSRLSFLVSLVVLMSVESAFASFVVADLPAPGAQSEIGTHVIIAGRGMEVGDQWLQAAHTQALIYKDRRNHGSIRLIAGLDDANAINYVREWGYQNIKAFGTFTGDQLVAQLLNIDKIASIDFIGHNGAILGFALENYDHRFFLKNVKALAPLKNHFTADAFVRLMGCNTGWNLAPAMASTFGVPVAGTFTSADIQMLHQDGNWYFDDVGRYPPGHFITRNSASYFSPIDCEHEGGCKRLKVVGTNYEGKHGVYKGTVPFLKFFCGTLPSTECFRRMALSTQYLVGAQALDDHSNIQTFAENLAEQFCPSSIEPIVRASCQAKVVDHLMGRAQLPAQFSTSAGSTLNCTFLGCQFKAVCKADCNLIGQQMATSTTFVDELNAYRAGLGLLDRVK